MAPASFVYKIVEIYWLDSTAKNEWIPLEAANEITADPIISIGILVSEDKDAVRITTSVSSEATVMDLLVIPRRAITEMYSLTVKRKRKALK